MRTRSGRLISVCCRRPSLPSVTPPRRWASKPSHPCSRSATSSCSTCASWTRRCARSGRRRPATSLMRTTPRTSAWHSTPRSGCRHKRTVVHRGQPVTCDWCVVMTARGWTSAIVDSHARFHGRGTHHQRWLAHSLLRDLAGVCACSLPRMRPVHVHVRPRIRPRLRMAMACAPVDVAIDQLQRRRRRRLAGRGHSQANADNRHVPSTSMRS